MIRLGDVAVRPLLGRLAAFGLLLAVGIGPVSSALDASGEIDAARQRLDRAREMAARPQPAPPLAAADGDRLLVAFRDRLNTLAGSGAAVVDWTSLEADPARPSVPHLRGVLRGTAEGLHGLAHAVETGSPLMAVEEADLAIDRPADPEIGRPTIMRLVLVTRGVVTGRPSEAGKAP